MIDKKILIENLKNNKWNKELVYTYKKTIKSDPAPPNEVVRIINFKFPEWKDENFYDAIIMGSGYGFPIETKYDMIEYIDYIENDYILIEKDPNEFDKIFGSHLSKQQQLSKDQFYSLTKLPTMRKIWTITDISLSIEILIVHSDNSITFMSWEFND